MDEKEIVELIGKDYSWEQIIYQIVAWEGMDPWNMDLVALSSSFLKFIDKIKELDFRVPAKYIIISSVLLRMKSDHLHFLDIINGGEMVYEELNGQEGSNSRVSEIDINPITMPVKRNPKRKMAVSELVDALRKALRTEEKRKVRGIRTRRQILINEENISKRIDDLYRKINDMIGRANKDKVTFSSLISKWERSEVADIFLPLIYLDHNKKIECSQEKVFDEIFIRKRQDS